MFDTSLSHRYDEGYNFIDYVLMDDLIVELDDDVDDISEVLAEIEMLMYDLNLDFKGRVYDAYANKFESYKKNISTIKTKLSGYPKDLLKFKNYYQQFDKGLSSTISGYTEEYERQTHTND